MARHILCVWAGTAAYPAAEETPVAAPVVGRRNTHCVECGAPLDGGPANRRFCARPCRDRYHNQRRVGPDKSRGQRVPDLRRLEEERRAVEGDRDWGRLADVVRRMREAEESQSR